MVASKVRFLGGGNNNGYEKPPVPGQPKAKKEQPSAPAMNEGVTDDDVLR